MKPETLLLCMGLIVFTGFISFICALFIVTSSYRQNGRYTEHIKSKLETGDEFCLSEIFQFEFDRAYVIPDAYIGGESIKRIYGLDIEIDDNKVKNLDHENYHRIIFVDAQRKFVYNFQYDVFDIWPMEEGMMVYPDTRIKRVAGEKPDRLCFEFLDVKPENYLVRQRP